MSGHHLGCSRHVDWSIREELISKDFKGTHQTFLSLQLKATHHAQEKVVVGRRASGATTSVVKTCCGINSDQ
jgi:hypothetical protein